MEIALDPDRPVPTLRLTGRFDGDGAAAFDEFVERLDPGADRRPSTASSWGSCRSQGLIAEAILRAEPT